MSDFAIIVPDSSPLITLAAAEALDTLLKPGLPVLVPDGVHWEVTRFMHLPGASDVVDWMKRNVDQVHLRATQEFLNMQALVSGGVKRIPNLGERCAAEIVDDEASHEPSRKSILVYEDSDVTLLRIMNHDKVAALTTADFLVELEAARLIQSADQILDDAVAAGRSDHVRHRAQLNALNAFRSRTGGGGIGG